MPDFLSDATYRTSNNVALIVDTDDMTDPNSDDQPQAQMKLAHAQEVLDRLDQVEGQFGQVKEGLAHLQRLSTLGTLTATVVHEFNNILTPVISYAQLALAEPDNTELGQKAHKKALEGAERASRLCASLLGYAREEESSGRACLIQAVQSSVNCLGRGLEKDGIRLELDLTDDIDVAMSPTSLEQVLVNIVLNARKAMAKKGGALTIRAKADQSMVQLDIADTGGGVPAEVADRLFEPFVTCPSGSSAKHEKGTGLGLSVCRDLITGAGGAISFDSTPGVGTTFHLVIPRAQPLRQSA